MHTPEQKKKYNANRRKKYAESAEHRAKVKARNKRHHEERGDQYNAKRREKYRTDEAFRQKCLEVQAEKRARPGYAEYARLYHRMYRYGVTPKKFYGLAEAQDWRCAICGQECGETETLSRKGVLVVDHCHDKEEVRGLLCGTCNAGLGQFFDNPETLRAAAKYLEDFNGSTKPR